MGWGEVGDQERSGVGCEELVVGRADDHGQAAGLKLVGDGVGWEGDCLAAAVGGVSSLGGTLYGGELALDGTGIGLDCGGGGVWDVGGVGWGGTEHDQVWGATNTPCIGSVDRQLDVWEQTLPVLVGEGN